MKLRKWVKTVLLILLLQVFLFPVLSYIFEEKDYIEIVVESGDTVWSIAETLDVNMNKNTNNIADWIVEENNLHNQMIYPGQKIVVPVESEERGVDLALLN
ncbi:cell division suppressor protein YneA [Cytobacillus gottheilii]|uniref:LysM peptidoglycan-binding domain-containing protein n=1 Tax=Cytobacillus gottheilii TaxID=859144 RepID=A0ABX8FIU7_9BACI|nr:LysM peptidoglycan-binding domain-containing protein [Cytobacillus gottheilii]QVY63954.1 LysM peptidoglycan-binding domain-containing protein [Cytobacillus gottheilii]